MSKGGCNVVNLLFFSFFVFAIMSMYVMVNHEVHITVTFGHQGIEDSHKQASLKSQQNRLVDAKKGAGGDAGNSFGMAALGGDWSLPEFHIPDFSNDDDEKDNLPADIGATRSENHKHVAPGSLQPLEFVDDISAPDETMSLLGLTKPNVKTMIDPIIATPQSKENMDVLTTPFDGLEQPSESDKKKVKAEFEVREQQRAKKKREHEAENARQEHDAKEKRMRAEQVTSARHGGQPVELNGLIPGTDGERRGSLVCDGKQIESEVIYWRIVPGDDTYESPITPHHANHHDRYLTFAYDDGGWNNVRMGVECIIVAAHAMGRTLVVPPQQHLYLLNSHHKDKEDKKPHGEMGFTDFFDMNLLRKQQGFHLLEMPDFLAKEGVTGGLHGMHPPQNSTDVHGQKLWKYLDKASDNSPEWQGSILAFPEKPSDFDKDLHTVMTGPNKERFKTFVDGRRIVYYDSKLQKLHHIHVPGDNNHRILQHHYSFVFFASREMQSFYRRFVRDYMRYKDVIQCSGADMVERVRHMSRSMGLNGTYYALHVRRGDFQFKEVKISAHDIVANLKGANNGEDIIPKGALVYLSTDDPTGVCEGCTVKRKLCKDYPKGAKPVGCQEDPSWKAFDEAGWNVRFLSDFLTPDEKVKHTGRINPNHYGMIESIVCSRASRFVGTYYSTFTGYIHRLRGYHGLGEESFYHFKRHVQSLRKKKSMGHGFPREWRAGWTDDAGGQI